MTISVHENNVAVLYHQYKPVGACAGDSRAVEKFIEECSAEHGNIKVYGEHRIVSMRQEEAAKAKEHAGTVA
jgi:hypothetical protein